MHLHPRAERTGLAPDEALRADLDRCIHCGLCLSACPTYDLLRVETEGPRGRIVLMDGLLSGEIGAEVEGLRRPLERCLGCRACETACPSGVPYGRLLEAARARLATRPSGPVEAARAALRRWALGRLLPSRGALGGLALAARATARAGLLDLAARPPFPARLRALAGLGAAAGARTAGPRPGDLLPAEGAERGRVALFLGCVQDAFLGRVNAATARVLQREGWTIEVPRDQTCCGAAALHAGEPALATELLRRNAKALDDAPRARPLVCNAGGCQAALMEAGRHLGPPGDALAARAVDLSTLLVRHARRRAFGTVPGRTAILDSCHLRHAVGERDAPRTLLDEIPELSRVELARPDRCCGSAGTYALEQPALAEAVLAAKVDEVRRADVRRLVVLNPGCQLWMARGIRRAGLPVEVLHLAELLDRAQAQA